jgi:spectinomycin phosphotransferase
MLEKPEIQDEKIIRCLTEAFGLRIKALSFLPLGADVNTAVYRAAADDGQVYFVKLRNGELAEASVAVPNFLHRSGLRQVIPALATQTGQPWATLDPFKVILYPYVDGHNGFEKGMSHEQWVEFGKALKQFHQAKIPAEFTAGINNESFPSRWRDTLKEFLQRIEKESFTEPVAAALAVFLKARKFETLELVKRADQLAQKTATRTPRIYFMPRRYPWLEPFHRSWRRSLHGGLGYADLCPQRTRFDVHWRRPRQQWIFAPGRRSHVLPGLWAN